MKLEAKHFRAIQYLALGMSMADVSRDAKTPVKTLYRWKNDPVFRAALDMEVKMQQDAAPEQVQALATECFSSLLDAHRQLRSFCMGAKALEYPKVMGLLGMLKFGGRFIKLSGFDPALKAAAAKLAFQKAPDPDAPEVPEFIPTDHECGPGDRDLPGNTQAERVPPARGAYSIEELAEWIRADRIKRGLATPEDLTDEIEAQKCLLLDALRELHQRAERLEAEQQGLGLRGEGLGHEQQEEQDNEQQDDEHQDNEQQEQRKQPGSHSATGSAPHATPAVPASADSPVSAARENSCPCDSALLAGKLAPEARPAPPHQIPDANNAENASRTLALPPLDAALLSSPASPSFKIQNSKLKTRPSGKPAPEPQPPVSPSPSTERGPGGEVTPPTKNANAA